MISNAYTVQSQIVQPTVENLEESAQIVKLILNKAQEHCNTRTLQPAIDDEGIVWFACGSGWDHLLILLLATTQTQIQTQMQIKIQIQIQIQMQLQMQVRIQIEMQIQIQMQMQMQMQI